MRPPARPSSRRRPRPSSRRARLLAERLEPRALLTISVEPRPDFVAYTGVPERLVAAIFTESDKALTAADFAATIDWGDGTTSAGDIAEAADGTFSVSGLKTYTKPGSYPYGQGAYPVTVTISSPVNGDVASTAEVDSPPLDFLGGGHGTSRGVAQGNQGHYLADDAAGGVVDYDFEAGGSPFIIVPGPGGATSSPTGLALLPGANDELVIVTADGTIATWTNPGIFNLPQTGLAATTVVDNSASDADYEGVTVGSIPTAGGGTEPVLYVANFASGKVEAYDAGTFARVDLGAGSFTDPGLPAGYAPFNVQDIGGTVYVAYAEQSGAKGQAVDGAGKGYVDAFDSTGHLLAHFDAGGTLNAPSGIALAPSEMGPYAGDLLVANTGDGTISVLDPSNPSAAAGSLPGVLGKVAGPGGGPLVIDGLWGLSTKTYSLNGSDYTYLYDSSDIAADQLGGFYYNPTLAQVSAPPTTGIADAPSTTLVFLDAPSHDLWLGQFIDATGAVDGSDAGSLSVTIDWGDGSAPTAGGLTFESGQNFPSGANYQISGTAPYTTPGTYHAKVTVAMAGGSSYTADVDVTVVDGSAPVIEPITVPGTPVNSAGAAPTIGMFPSVFAFAAQPSPIKLGSVTGPAEPYTVLINWGDGTPASVGQVQPGLLPTAPGSSYYTLTGTHTYAAAGTYNVVVALQWPGAPPLFGTTTAHVLGLGVVANPVGFPAVQGQTLTAGLGSFTYNHSASLPTSDFSATVDWGDGSPKTAAQVVLMLPPGGTATPYYEVVGSHVYHTTGAYAPFVTVVAPDGESATFQDAVVATPDPTGPTNVTPGATLVATQAQATPDSLLATFDAPAGAYKGAVAWGDGSAPIFVSVRPIGPDGGLVEYGVYGSHTYAVTGGFKAAVGIIAPNGDLDPVALPVVVLPLPGAPTNLSTTPVSGYAGVGLTGVLANFSGKINGDVGYRATIDWGDGTAPVFGAVQGIVYPADAIAITGANFAVDGTHAYAATGTYRITIDILAPDGSSTWTSTTATITAAPAPTPGNFDPQGAVGVEQGLPTAGIILALFNSTPGTYASAVDWGDGSAPSPGTIVQVGYVPSGGSTNGNLPSYQVRGSHAYAAAGAYTAKVNLVGPGGVSKWVSDTVTVAPGSEGPIQLKATQGIPLTAGLATFEFQGFTPLPPASSFTALIDWADGTPVTPGIVATGPTTFGSAMWFPDERVGVGGTHTYATAGTYTVGIELVAADGERAMTTAQVVVAPDAAAPSELAPLAVGGMQDVPIDATLAVFKLPGFGAAAVAGDIAAVDWGDGSPPSPATIVPLAIPAIVGYNGPNWGIQGPHTYLAPGTYPVTVYLARPGGERDRITTTSAIAADPDPVTNLSATPVTGTQGVALTDAALALFNAPDPAGYKVAVDWGDGSGPTFGKVAPFAASDPLESLGKVDAEATGSHTYASQGSYKITIDLIGPHGESLWLGTTATIAPGPATATPAWFAAMAQARQIADRSRLG